MKNLKTYRMKSGLTQEQLAKKANISRITIAILESGKQKEVKSSTLIKLSGALQIEPQFLLYPES